MPIQVDHVMHRARQIRHRIRTEIQQAPPAAAMQRPGERWSARDVLIHLGNWEAEAVTWFHHLLKQEPIPPIAIPIDQWNAEHMAPYADLDLAGAIAYIEGTRRELEQIATQITAEHLSSNSSFLGLLQMTPEHEIGHLHQIREALALAQGDLHAGARHYLAYTRQRVLTRFNLEFRSTASLEWKPEPEAWSIKEMLIHLAIRDRQWTQDLQAFGTGEPLPEPATAVDEATKQAVLAESYQTLGEIIHELGAARGALEVELDRLTAAQITAPAVQAWLKAVRKHDDQYMYQMLDRIAAWRKAQ